jgi:hypothetical protein
LETPKLKSSFWNVSSFNKKTCSLQASQSKNIFLNRGIPAYSYLPPTTTRGRESKPLMEMRCVRPLSILVTGLKCGQQLQVRNSKALCAYQALNIADFEII